MYHKVIIMELKENYALVMAEEGQILRVRRKEGMEVGDCIYILEEDLVSGQDYKKDHETSVIDFSEEKKKRNPRKIWKQMVAAAAAIAIFVTSATILTKPGKAYAMVSVDGEKNVELLIDQKHKVTKVESGNSQFAEEVKDLKGEKVDAVKDYFEEESARKETVIVGYALCEDATEQEVAAIQRQLEKIFGTEHILYIGGDQEDIEQAKKEGKSLGMYLAEQAVSEKEFNSIIYEGTEKELLEMLENHPNLMKNQTLKQTIQHILSEDEEEEDAEESEKEELEIEEKEEQEEAEREKKEEEAERLEDIKESSREEESPKKEETIQQKPVESDDRDTESEELDEPDSSDDEREDEEEDD